MDGHGGAADDVGSDVRVGVSAGNALGRRALEALALAGAAAMTPAAVPAVREGCSAAELRAAVVALEGGVTTLARALGVAEPDPVVASALDGDAAGAAEADRRRLRACLRRAAEITACLGEASRQVAWGAGLAGQEPAADAADGIMTAASSLRMLAEIGLRAVPPIDAGEVLPR